MPSSDIMTGYQDRKCQRCKKHTDMQQFHSTHTKKFGKWCKVCCALRGAYNRTQKKTAPRRVIAPDKCSKCSGPRDKDNQLKTCKKCRDRTKDWTKEDLTKKKEAQQRRQNYESGSTRPGPTIVLNPVDTNPPCTNPIDDNELIMQFGRWITGESPQPPSHHPPSHQPPSHPADAVGDFSDDSLDLLNGLEDPDDVDPITEFDVDPIDVFVHDLEFHLELALSAEWER